MIDFLIEFEIQMVARGIPRRADGTDHLTGVYHLPGLHVNLGQMTVSRRIGHSADGARMLDLDMVAERITAVVALAEIMRAAGINGRNVTRRGRDHRRALRRGDIDRLMVSAVVESGADPRIPGQRP